VSANVWRGNYTISDRCAHLGDDIIEATECLKSMSELVFDTGSEVEQMEKVLLDLQHCAEHLEDGRNRLPLPWLTTGLAKEAQKEGVRV